MTHRNGESLDVFCSASADLMFFHLLLQIKNGGGFRSVCEETSSKNSGVSLVQ